MAGMLDEPKGGLLDFFASPAGQGLLSAVGAGLAGARRGAPLNTIGAGMLGGLQGYANAQDQQAQMKRMDQHGKLFDMTMQQHQAAQEAAKRAQDAAAARQGYLGSVGRVTSPVVGAQPNQFDPMKWMQLGGSVEDAQRLASAKDWGASEVARTIEGTDAKGNKVTYQYDKFGRPIGDGVQAYIAPVQVDLGGRVQFVKPSAGVSLAKGMTPGEVDAAKRASQAVTYQQDADGNFVALPTRIEGGSIVRGTPVVAGPGMQPLKGPQKDAKLTESEGKATLYLGQMASATKVLNDLESKGVSPFPVSVAMANTGFGNIAASPDAQQVAQAQNQWSEAYLRQKTGAAATKDEITLNNRTFFPQIGDSAEVIAQKKNMRSQAEQGMRIPAGRGANQIRGAGPAVGDVIDGYRFKGGNPADRSSWEKQ